MPKSYFVYILKCNDGSYYTGVTNNIIRRLSEHESGRSEGAYTASRRPVQLVYAEEFGYILNAIAREKNIKGWSRAKKEALIAQRLDDLKKLSKKIFPPKDEAPERSEEQ